MSDNKKITIEKTSVVFKLGFHRAVSVILEIIKNKTHTIESLIDILESSALLNESANQEILGKEFQKVYDDNKSELYE